MNLRKKAKHYKRLYEQSKHYCAAPIFHSTKHNIVRLAVKQTVSSEIVNDTLNPNAETPMSAI